MQPGHRFCQAPKHHILCHWIRSDAKCDAISQHRQASLWDSPDGTVPGVLLDEAPSDNHAANVSVNEPPDALDEAAGGAVRDRMPSRLTAIVEVMLCSGFATQLLLIQVLALLGLHPLGPDGRLSIGYVWTLSMLDAALLIALMLFFLRVHGESPRALFLGDRAGLSEGVVGLAVTPAIFLLAMGSMASIRQYAPDLHNVAVNPLADLIRTPTDAWLFATVAIVAGGIREEMQRAFILHRFEQHLGGAMVGLVLFSVVFGAGHLLQGWDTAVVTGLLGAAWGLLYLRRRSIVAPGVSHSVFNVSQILGYIASS